MTKKMKRSFVLLMFLIVTNVPIFLYAIENPTHAMSSTYVHPSLGLHSNEPNSIISGSEFFDFTDMESFSKQEAIKTSKYRIVGKQPVTFEIPFFSTYTQLPQFHVTVNKQIINGDIWYGDNEIWYGTSYSYLDPLNSDKSIIKQKLKYLYAPVLDNTIIGTLYTIIPSTNEMTIRLKLEKSCCYVYEKNNVQTELHNSDGSINLCYENALSQSIYQYFFIDENSVVDFLSNCKYTTETITFKEFIDRNYNIEKDFYETIGVSENCLYAIANRLLQTKGAMTFNELFFDALNRVGLNVYQFTIPLYGEAVIEYTTRINIQVNKSYEPAVYIIGHKQIGDYPTAYSIKLNHMMPYILQSNAKIEKNNLLYHANSTENIYFICGGTKKTPTNSTVSFNKTKFIVSVAVLSTLIVISLIVFLINIVKVIKEIQKS